MKSKKIEYDNTREKLLHSMQCIFSGETNKNLLKAIRLNFPSLSSAFVVNWIPEQGEDIYFVLIDDSHIAVIEVPREEVDANAMVEILRLSEYRRRKLSVEVRRKLEAALILMAETTSRTAWSALNNS